MLCLLNRLGVKSVLVNRKVGKKKLIVFQKSKPSDILKYYFFCEKVLNGLDEIDVNRNLERSTLELMQITLHNSKHMGLYKLQLQAA